MPLALAPLLALAARQVLDADQPFERQLCETGERQQLARTRKFCYRPSVTYPTSARISLADPEATFNLCFVRLE
jgi:hypothetical protein